MPSDNENVAETVAVGFHELVSVSNGGQKEPSERSKTPDFFQQTKDESEPDDSSKINYIRKRKRD